jgi:hypothetical protein
MLITYNKMYYYSKEKCTTIARRFFRKKAWVRKIKSNYYIQDQFFIWITHLHIKNSNKALDFRLRLVYYRYNLGECMIKLNYIKQTAFEYFDVWSYVKYWDSFRSYRFCRNEFFVKHFGYKNFK